ncbi:hypothetical protein IEN91_04775 [Bacillus velezensis]|uniref:hypothetical protein n=1 Tax=Bacillus velezensis TaxID=492670 RepID=UPI0018C596C0|nr:hypothetical protein [Bacillus velezensis]QPK89758.1 hypothetical protein IEN91_04775 [Bacillus velezensis]
MLNSENYSKLEFENRGKVLAGIISNPKAERYGLLEEIDDIVNGDMEKHRKINDVYIIRDHWVVFNPEERYWGVYYKKGHECIIDARESNGGSDAVTFTNHQYA